MSLSALDGLQRQPTRGEFDATNRALVALADELHALRSELGLPAVEDLPAVAQARLLLPEAQARLAEETRARYKAPRPLSSQPAVFDAHQSSRAAREESYRRHFDYPTNPWTLQKRFVDS